ncbi:hypothetical protein PLESTM_000054300 [Pleodorina starrii]|nr:hypothetical protein PLESTM_000054300 [Pleodorina starrii]
MIGSPEMHVSSPSSRSPAVRWCGTSRRPACARPPRAFQPAAGRRRAPAPPTCTTSLTTSPLCTISPSTIAGAPSPPPASVTTNHLPTNRRSLLLLSGVATAAAALSLPCPAAAKSVAASVEPGDWSSPGLGAPVDPSQPRFVKLPSGVRFQELNVGSGPMAGPGETVLFDYVLRRSNGYFIYGTVEGVSFQPRDVPVAPVSCKLGSGELVAGLEEVLSGMAPGSKRRALIPPELGYVGGEELPQPPTFATKRQLENHRREPLLFEVQMLRVGGRK